MPETLKLFISYRSSDAPKVDKIARDLALLKHEDGTPRYAPWQDKHNLPPASPHWWDAIVDAIDECPAFVFHVSEASLKSAVCQAELEYAHRRNRPIIPIVLEGEFFLNDVSGKYDLPKASWTHVPTWLGERQFLFYTGADFFRQFELAMDVFRRAWPRDLYAPRPMDPAPNTNQTRNYVLYDQACDFAERLAFAEAEKLFEGLVRRNDRDFGAVAAEWLELLRRYGELIELDALPRLHFRFKPRWEEYIALFPKAFADETWIFDPKGFATRGSGKTPAPPAPSVVQMPSPVKDMTAEEYFERGTNHQKKKEYGPAIADYTEAIRLNPEYAHAYFNRGKSYHIKGEYDRAIADYTEAIHLTSQYADAYFNRGDCYSFKGNYDAAIADYDQAVHLKPSYTSTTINRKKKIEARTTSPSAPAKSMTAREYFERGQEHLGNLRHDQAIADYTEAIRLNPKLVDAYFYRGGSYMVKGDIDQAISDYTEAIRLNPQYAIGYYWRGQSYFLKKEYDRAIADYDTVLRIEPEHPLVGLHREKALKEHVANQPLSPKNMTAEEYRDRALNHHLKGDHDRAIVDYTEAIRLNPQYAISYFNRGLSYHVRGEYDHAIADYDMALQIDPNYILAANNRKAAIEAKKKQEQ